jgi:hypothetical protein
MIAEVNVAMQQSFAGMIHARRFPPKRQLARGVPIAGFRPIEFSYRKWKKSM